MSIIDLQKDLERSTLTIVSEHAAPVDRVWRLWADPRLLERWWGPPSHPATFTEHDLSPGGSVRYYMTGPDGQRYHGGWGVLSVDEPRRLEFEDYFANDDGTVNADMPVSSTVVSIEDIGDGTTRMTLESRYPSREAMEKVLEMGMEQGIRQALGQIDDLLAARSV